MHRRGERRRLRPALAAAGHRPLGVRARGPRARRRGREALSLRRPSAIMPRARCRPARSPAPRRLAMPKDRDRQSVARRWQCQVTLIRGASARVASRSRWTTPACLWRRRSSAASALRGGLVEQRRNSRTARSRRRSRRRIPRWSLSMRAATPAERSWNSGLSAACRSAPSMWACCITPLANSAAFRRPGELIHQRARRQG